MRITLKWRKHPNYPKTTIIGQADDLPDAKCRYTITRLKNGHFSVGLPAVRLDDYFRVMVLRDATIARQFCEDDLNYNLLAVIKHQLREMRNTNQHPIKPPQHYEQLLQKYARLMEQNKTPPKVAA